MDVIDQFDRPPEPTKQADEPDYTKNEKLAAVLQASDQWDLIKRQFQARIDHYRRNLADVDQSKLPLNEIGQRYVVCDAIATELEGLISWVEQTAKEVNKKK